MVLGCVCDVLAIEANTEKIGNTGNTALNIVGVCSWVIVAWRTLYNIVHVLNWIGFYVIRHTVIGH